LTTINLDQFTNSDIRKVVMECRTTLEYSREELAKVLRLSVKTVRDMEIQSIKEYVPPWVDTK